MKLIFEFTEKLGFPIMVALLLVFVFTVFIGGVLMIFRYIGKRHIAFMDKLDANQDAQQATLTKIGDTLVVMQECHEEQTKILNTMQSEVREVKARVGVIETHVGLAKEP